MVRPLLQVLELPAEICDTVEVQYKPPGRLSAGLTCQMSILFTPKASLNPPDLSAYEPKPLMLIMAYHLKQSAHCVCPYWHSMDHLKELPKCLSLPCRSTMLLMFEPKPCLGLPNADRAADGRLQLYVLTWNLLPLFTLSVHPQVTQSSFHGDNAQCTTAMFRFRAHVRLCGKADMQANEDIQSSIPLLSETGPIVIPLSCLIKRAVISVQPQVSIHHVLC